MLKPDDIASAKEHFDVLAILFFLATAALLSACLYIMRQHNQSDSKTIAEVEKHAADIIRLQEQCKQVDRTASTVDRQGKDIARLYTGVGKIMAAHNVNHPGQNLEV